MVHVIYSEGAALPPRYTDGRRRVVLETVAQAMAVHEAAQAEADIDGDADATESIASAPPSVSSSPDSLPEQCVCVDPNGRQCINSARPKGECPDESDGLCFECDPVEGSLNRGRLPLMRTLLVSVRR